MKIEFIKKNKTDKKIVFIDLNEENEKELKNIENKIFNLINNDIVPSPDLKNGCKKFAYYEYCFIQMKVKIYIWQLEH